MTRIAIALIMLGAEACADPPAPKPPPRPAPVVTAPPPSYGRKVVRYDPAPAASLTDAIGAAQGVLDALSIDAGTEPPK
jgi:hypothetical protein